MTLLSAGQKATWKWNAILGGVSVFWILIFGNPLESLERRFFDQALRLRARIGSTPPGDSRIVILGADETDLAELPSLEEEYRAVARLITEAGELGAATVIFDTIYVRGSAEMAKPIFAAIAQGPAPVVMAEAIGLLPGGTSETRRLRS